MTLCGKGGWVKDAAIVFPNEEDMERGFLELRVPKKPWGHRWESRSAAVAEDRLYITRRHNPNLGFVINLDSGLNSFLINRKPPSKGSNKGRKTIFELSLVKGPVVVLRVTCREEERFWLPLLTQSKDPARYVWRKDSARSMEPKTSVQGLIFGPSQHLSRQHSLGGGSQISVRSSTHGGSGEVASTVKLLLDRLSSRDRELAEMATTNTGPGLKTESDVRKATEPWDLTQMSSEGCGGFSFASVDPVNKVPKEDMTPAVSSPSQESEEVSQVMRSFTSIESLPIVESTHADTSIRSEPIRTEELRSESDKSDESTLKESLPPIVSDSLDGTAEEPTLLPKTPTSEGGGPDSGVQISATMSSDMTNPHQPQTRKDDETAHKIAEKTPNELRQTYSGTMACGTGQFTGREAVKTKAPPPPPPPLPFNFLPSSQPRLWVNQPFQTKSYDPTMVKCGLCRKMHAPSMDSDKPWETSCGTSLMEELTAALKKRRATNDPDLSPSVSFALTN